MEERKFEFYKSLGLKLTPQRLAILEYLENNREHPSAEDIYNALKPKFPSMSFATVYNTLEILTLKGIVKEIIVDPYKKRFDPFTHPHHHFICRKCKRVVDVEIDFMPSIPEELRGHKVEDFQIVFLGICRDCKAV